MLVLISTVFTQVLKANQTELSLVRRACQARPKGYRFIKKYRSGQWNGFISLYSKGYFPTGLLQRVEKALAKNDFTVEKTYNFKPDKFPLVTETTLPGIVLRDYQVSAANQLIQASRGIAKLATNAGKTEIMVAMYSVMQKKTLIVVRKKVLMHNLANRFQKRLGLKCGLIGEGKWQVGKVTVAIINTLANHPEKVKNDFSDCEILFVDECHSARSDQMLDILPQIPAKYRYGFSGTPLRNLELSDLKIQAHTGPIVCELTNAELIEAGHSAVPKIKLHTIKNKGSKDLDYQEAYKKLIVQNEQRNEKIKEIALQDKDGLVLILVRIIEHGKELNRMIPGSIFLHGGTEDKKRQDLLAKMRKENKGIYIASTIFDEGVDIPGITTFILALGGTGETGAGDRTGANVLLQRLGRSLRATANKIIVFIHDFKDYGNQYLLKHSKQRVKVYLQEGFEIVKEK